LRSQPRPHQFKPTALSPAVAYRKDVEKRKGPVGKDDGSWIVVSTIVGHIAFARGKDRRRFLDDAAKMAGELFDPAALAYGCAFDPPKVDRGSSIAVLRLLAEKMENVGTLNLATSLLEGLAGVLPVDSVNSGRVLAQRARLSWKMGKTDLALARYQHLRRKARKIKNNELVIRSYGGFAALAQLRGNYPAVRRWSELLVSRAELGEYKRLASLGHHGLMLVHTRAGEIKDAITHGWLAFCGREGHQEGQVEILSNIGQLFLEAGRPAIARDAFVRVLGASPSTRVCTPALGGYALTSAALNDHRAVHWAAAEACAISDRPEFGYETASTLLDCASALDAIGEAPYGSVLRARGSTIAQYAGYHELVHRAETAPQLYPSRALTDLPILVEQGIAQLPEVTLPDHLELVTL
jgi:tetratricopeptide (TPR) repeat protein